MHISMVYLSTYSQEAPIKGYFEVQDDGDKLQLKFTPEEAAVIQTLCAGALERSRQELVEKLLSASVLPLALAAPIIETVDFEEVAF